MLKALILHMQPPMVSVWMITYNHEKYIRQSLESVVTQKTDFTFEVIIGEDCSTDGTRAIVKEFEARYPDIIKPVYHNVNVGALRNAYEFCYPKLSGRYVACLEGDDYWTDDHKLQKQVDLMEAHPEYAICFHQVYELRGEKNFNKSELYSAASGSIKEFSVEDLAREGNFIHSPSVLFRNFLIPQFPSWFATSPVQDYVLHMLNARHGKLAYIPEPMSVYRRHDQGSWGTKSHEYQIATWLIVLESLIQEFSNSPGISERLKSQFGNNIIHLSGIYHTQGNDEKSAHYLKKAFTVSENFMNKWFYEQRDNYSRLQAELAEVRTAQSRQTTFGVIRKLLSAVKRKLNGKTTTGKGSGNHTIHIADADVS